MKEIKLTQNKTALIDDADFDWLNQWKWYADKAKHTFYAATNNIGNGEAKKIYMHRLIMKARPGEHIDHKTGNGLDCQRNNMRTCTNAENRRNRRKANGVASKYKGIYAIKSGKWAARICLNYKQMFLGYFNTEIEAAKAYNEAALKYHGEFANLNKISLLSE